jgi:mitochondrial import receptor subunit TOM40
MASTFKTTAGTGAGEETHARDSSPGRDTTIRREELPSGLRDALPYTSSSWWWRAIERTELPNPGAYEEINQEANTVLRPNLFDGTRFDMNLPLTPTLSTGHSIEMGSTQTTPGYALSVNYITNTLIAVSRMDMTGRFNGRLFYTHTPRLISKLLVSRQPAEDPAAAAAMLAAATGGAAIQPPPPTSATTTVMYDLDYRGSDYSANLKLGTGGVISLAYMQSIVPSFSMGGEGFFQLRNKFSALTAAARFLTTDGIFSATVASFGPVVASYVHRVNPRVSLAAELFWDTRSRESYVTAGYKFDLRSATVIGQVTSLGKVAALLEEKLSPGVSFLLSGEIDHWQQQYKFGFGLQVGGTA